MDNSLNNTTERINELDYKLSLNPETSARGEVCGDVQSKLAESMRGGADLDAIKVRMGGRGGGEGV